MKGMLTAALSAILLGVWPGPAPAQGPSLTHGPVLGGVTHDQAKVFVRTSQATNVAVRYSIYPTLTPYYEVTGSTDAQKDNTAILTLPNLGSSTPAPLTWYYRVLVNGAPATEIASFRTFPIGAYNNLKLVVIGDTGNQTTGDPQGVGPVFVKAKDEGAFLALMPGDFDHQNKQTVDDKRTVRKTLYDPVSTGHDFIELAKRTPTAYIWDDHDYGADDSDGRDSILSGPDQGKGAGFPFKCEAISVYMEYVPSYSLTGVPSDVCGPHFTRLPPPDWHTQWPVTLPKGIWQSFLIGHVKVILLDTRTQRHRPNNNMLDNYGLEQREWLESQLCDGPTNPCNPSTAIVWRVIVSSSVWNRTLTKGDSWAGFRMEQDELIGFIRSKGIKNVLIVSGDVHWGALDDGTNGGLGTGDCGTLPATGCLPQMVVPNTNMTIHRQCAWDSQWSGATDPVWTDLEQWGVPDYPRCDPDPDPAPHYGEDVILDNDPGVFNGYGVLTFQTTPSHRVTMEIKNHKAIVRRTLTILAQ
jgi:hypothetical protein